MKTIYLSVLFYFLIGFINGQTIEVIVTDTIICEVENYSYLLVVNFGGNNQIRKKDAFEDGLTLDKASYVFLYEEQIVNDRDYYLTATYEIKFMSLMDKEHFEMTMETEKQLYALTLLQMKVAYVEKEKIRLIEKLIHKGNQQASIIAQGMGRNLGELRSIEELTNANYNIPEDVVLLKRLGKTENFSKKNETAKEKTLRITFDTIE